jgi:hypothetical protein
MSQSGIRIPKADLQQAGTLLIGILTIIFQPPAIFFLLIESPCMPPFLGSVFLVSASGVCSSPRDTANLLRSLRGCIYVGHTSGLAPGRLLLLVRRPLFVHKLHSNNPSVNMDCLKFEKWQYEYIVDILSKRSFPFSLGEKPEKKRIHK